ncbi:FtsX-like permease family protein [Actinophytocola sp.]|uniref:ABC transporter permease n=1 Tax=Actinophytocola sp. TaxID=1872138 RepID=UPI003D6A8A52
MSRGWRPALRIARRSMWRHLGRSVLIASLIAVPIAGATVMDGLLQTMTSAEANAYDAMGDADGQAEVTQFSTLPGWQPGTYPDTTEEGDRDPAAVDLAGLLPPGSRVVPELTSSSLRLTEGDRIVRTQLDEVALGDPLTAHQARLESGRLPDGPDEVLVTVPLAERLGLLDGEVLRPGARVTGEGGPSVAVTGLAVAPRAIGREAVFARPGAALADSPGSTPFSEEAPSRFLVDLPSGTDVDAVWPALAAEHGVTLLPRTAYTERDRYPAMLGSDDVLETTGPVALVVGFGLLEVVLLAGAAFAVGARRQVRELGLIAANGGTGKHVGRTVLAQGLILGLLGAVGGLLLGGVVIFAAWPLWEGLTGRLVDGWRFGWPELTVAGLVGMLSGLAAALLPAVGASRLRPVDALAQRFRSTSLRARLPVLGVVLLAVGVVGVLGSGMLARREIEENLAVREQTYNYVQADHTLPTIGVLVAGLLAVAGIIMITSGLVAALARTGGRLPLSGRLALRDAGRHRHRTVPAVAAIMIVVTGSVTMAFSFAAVAAGDLRNQPDNTIMVRPDPSINAVGETPSAEERRDFVEGTGEVAAELPESSVVEVRTVQDEAGSMVGFASGGSPTCPFSGVGVASPEVLALVLDERPNPGLLAALDRGEAVVLDDCVMANGTARTEPSTEGAEPVVLPARHQPRPDGTAYFSLPGAFVSPATARAHGWTETVDMAAVPHSASASADEVDAAITSAEDHGFDVWEHSETADELNVVNMSLAAGAGLVTLLGVAITVALSVAESRADLATLAAIGAQPRRRRTFAGAQAFVLSGLGTVLGVALGGVLGFAVGPLSGQLEFAVPWSNLAVTVAVVPLLAVAVAMVATRAKLPMVRRVD